MNAIIEFLSAFADATISVIEFVINFFGDLVYMVRLTGKFLGQIPGYFRWLPDSLVALLMVIFTLVVLYKIIGRE